MTNLLEDLINNYLDSLPEPIEIDKMKKVSVLRHDIKDITDIEFNEKFLTTLYEKDDISKILDNILFIQKIIYAEKKGIHFDLEEVQKKFLDSFIEKVEERLTEEEEKIKKYKEPYTKILLKLKNKELITEIDFIIKVLEDSKISYEEKNKIIIELLKYNSYVSNNQNNKEEDKNEKDVFTKEQLKELLVKYSYDIDKIKEEYIKLILNEGNYDNIKDLLEQLKSRAYGFIKEDDPLFSSILAYSKSEVLDKLKEIADEEGFPISRLQKSKNVFIPKRDTRRKGIDYKKPLIVSGYENFLEIIDILKRNNISVQEVVNNCSYLFRFSPITIRNNIVSFKLYEMKSSARVGMSNFSWMTASCLMDTCDKFIELGLYNYVKRFNSRLTLPADSLSFYRIYYAQKHGLNYYHYTENSGQTFCLKSEVFNTNNAFNIHDLEQAKKMCESVELPKRPFIETILLDNLNNKLNIVFSNKLLGQLEKYKRDKYTYDFNGKFISRFKVLRLAETLLKEDINIDKDLLLYLITHNSIITNDELEKIREIVDSLNYERSLY